MKREIRLSTLALLLFFASTVLGQKKSTENKDEIVTLLEMIQQSIDDAKTSINTTNLNLETAEIELKVTKTIEAKTGIKLLIFKADGTYNHESAGTLTFTLKAKGKQDTLNEKINKEQQKLTDLIRAACDKYVLASESGILKGMEPKGFKVELSFTITTQVEAGVDTWVISPVTIDGTGSYSKETAHTITLEFGGPDTSKSEKSDLKKG